MTTSLPWHKPCPRCGSWLKRGPRGIYRHRKGAGARCLAGRRQSTAQPSLSCLYCGLPTDGNGELCLACALKRDSELESMS